MRQKVMDKKYMATRNTLFAPEIDSIRDIDIPDSFDAREHWYNCASIGAIRDQAQCGINFVYEAYFDSLLLGFWCSRSHN